MDLNFTGHFITPIYFQEIEQWAKPLNKACDKHIKDAKNREKTFFKERSKNLNKNIKDFGLSHHSSSLENLPEFKEIQDYVLKSSNKILDHMGYNLTNYNLFYTELWVQEFAKGGAGHHEAHIHYDNHISGFYFLKCSDRTSFPVFNDPRLGKTTCQLPEKNPADTTFASQGIKFDIRPGTLILFPSYLQHLFPVDYGIDPFRFIHFNLQAVRKSITDKFKK